MVHLVWGPLGVEPLRRFLASYRAHAAGVEHELVIALNGLDIEGLSGDSREGIRAALQDVDHTPLVLPRPVLDLAAYVQVAEQLSHDRLCFLNSHSELLAADWLTKLDAALRTPGVGIVGASGSWVGNRSLALHALGLPSAYRDVMPARQIAREQFAQMQAEHPGDSGTGAQRGRVRAFVSNLPALGAQLARFDSFPAHHLRTNAFMLPRSVLGGLRIGRLTSKADTYRLESGTHNLTKQIRRAGLRALVLDRAGGAYEPERWDRSRTLYQADQEGLLVADNQTRLYDTGSADRRRLLSVLAWGRQAAPSLPPERP